MESLRLHIGASFYHVVLVNFSYCVKTTQKLWMRRMLIIRARLETSSLTDPGSTLPRSSGKVNLEMCTGACIVPQQLALSRYPWLSRPAKLIRTGPWRTSSWKKPVSSNFDGRADRIFQKNSNDLNNGPLNNVTI